MPGAKFGICIPKGAGILTASSFLILAGACSQASETTANKPAAQAAQERVEAPSEAIITQVESAEETVAMTGASDLKEAEPMLRTAEELEAKAVELQNAAEAENAGDDVSAGAVVNASGDPEAGKRVFAVCRSCHSADVGRNGLGPSLAGVAGREAGTIEGFKYSDAVKASGVTWTAENLDAWLVDSAGFIPGNRMSQLFRPGVQDDKKRADLIAYLGTL